MGILDKIFRKKKMAKKFDIIVRDNDLDQTMHPPTPVYGVMASSRKALIETYAMCDQVIEIVKEYEDSESQNYGKTSSEEAAMIYKTDNTQTNKVQTETQVSQQKDVQNVDLQPFNTQTVNTQPVYIKQNEPPRFFEIGGIKCKMENGKMYQKQWMRLSDVESSEFRIVSDKNNKICPIKDKHIEVMKWVLVDDDTDNQTHETKTTLLKG